MGMYHYFIGDMELPLAPEKYTLRLPPANQTVRLADGREISFELLLPYFAESPLLRDGVAVQRPIYYLNRLAEWAESGEPRRLIIYRSLPSGEEIFNTSLLVSLEEYQVLEAADLGFDVRVSLRLKEYQERVCQKYAASL